MLERVGLQRLSLALQSIIRRLGTQCDTLEALVPAAESHQTSTDGPALQAILERLDRIEAAQADTARLIAQSTAAAPGRADFADLLGAVQALGQTPDDGATEWTERGDGAPADD